MDISSQQISDDLLKQLTRSELYKLIKAEQSVRLSMQEQLVELQSLNTELRSGLAHIGGILVKFQNRIFGKSSERSKINKPPPKKSNKKKRSYTCKLPSERYPDATIIERDIEFQTPPSCKCCDASMSDSGLTEVSEYLQVIPKEHVIIRQIRHKYRCSKCHGALKTAPGIPRIKAGSSYSDDMIIDIAMSKYCDLLPIERYKAMAERLGFPGLPANSLIESTHYLASFVEKAVDKVKEEVLSGRVLMADETPHRMLEDSEKSSWYLWGFSNERACYFECHDTRSGDVASNLLKDGKCEVLVSDVYSGYAKAVRVTNEQRALAGKPPLLNAYCNAHARRKFKECEQDFGEVIELFLDDYKEIYSIESRCKKAEPSKVTEIRKDMLPIFDRIKQRAETQIDSYSSKSSISKACKYFLTNYEGLTLFISNLDVPIDNNPQERALRSPVIGRKTWIGTHSKKGAETAAKLFTLVETCKLNKVNPRAYFKCLVHELHMDRDPLTPWQFKEREKT